MSIVRRSAVAACFAVAGLLASTALAYVCHPGAAGTRMLTLSGSVMSVRAHGADFQLLLRTSPGRCSHVLWNTATGASSMAAATCGAPVRLAASTALPRLSAVAAGQRLVVTRGGLGQPDALSVYGRANQLLRSLPLPARPQTLEVFGGLAVFAAKGQGVFALRLSDGLFGYLGPDGGTFAPRLDAHGVVFHDGESKLALREGKTVLEFLPRSAIVKTIAATAKPLVTGGPIRALSMDGPRVAVAVGDTKGVCDRVLYWNVTWRPVQRISAPSGPTCMVRPHGVQISSLAIGGFRAEWLVSQPGAVRLVAGSPLCQEWVLGRFRNVGQVTSLAGDGSTLAFASTVNGRSSVALVNGRYRPVEIATGSGSPMLAANHTTVAILWPGGRVEVRSHTGRVIAAFHVAQARAVALSGNALAVLGGDRLSVFDVAAGKLVHRWAVPTGAKGLDVQYGIAGFAQGRNSVVLDTATGRTAVVGHGPSKLVGVQIEGPGLAYAWTSGSRGVARFVTMRQLELALGRL